VRSGEVADDRDHEISRLERLEVLEIVFAREIVRLFAGEIALEQQLSQVRVVLPRRAAEARELEVEPSVEERLLDVADRLELRRCQGMP
jgi:hypothetical protein